MLQDRFKFDVLRFQDANFGVAEKRTKEFCEAMVDLKVPIHWNGTIEIETIMRYSEETLDLLQASQCHLLWLGAEAGTKEMQEHIKKKIKIDQTSPRRSASSRSGTSSPGRSGSSATRARPTTRWPRRCGRRPSSSTPTRSPARRSYPFRPIPGTEDFDRAVKLGYDPPKGFDEWGKCFEYKYNAHNTPLPEDIRETWRHYNKHRGHLRHARHRGPAVDAAAAVQGRGLASQERHLHLPGRAEAVRPVRPASRAQRDPGSDDYSEDYEQLQPEAHAEKWAAASSS